MTVRVKQSKKTILVENDFWSVRHNLSAGGCWDEIVFKNGTGKNLLNAPAGSRIRCLEPHPTSDNSSPYFYCEKNEREPVVKVETTDGMVSVLVEGRYQLASPPPAGADVPRVLPVRYRRRYDYKDWGLVSCTLEIIADEPRHDVVEVVAVDIPLRDGMTDCLVRDHPTAMTGTDRLEMGKWHKIEPGWAGAHHRYVPVHLVCFERGTEGLEFFPTSDLEAWDVLSSEQGMGLYGVMPDWEDPKRTIMSIAPYCVAYRRNPTVLQGTTTFRYNIGLPFVKPAADVGPKTFHMAVGSRWPTDEQLAHAAASGVRLVRFHNDYREDGPFWHDGMYPPYDPEGMEHLRRIINTCHRLGMKIVPYISVKEFHPESQQFAENEPAWRREAGQSFKPLHTWAGSGEFGQLMCLESGWLQRRKQDIETILSDLPWDGLYFDWCTPHPCSHPGHLGGHLHTDQDAFIDFMFWVRKRVGPEGVILSHISGLPQIVVENLSTATLIYEDLYGGVHPERPTLFPAQVKFMPIVPRFLIAWGAAGTPVLRKCVMNSLLAGAPPAIGNVIPGTAAAELAAEFGRITSRNLSGYKFHAAGTGAVTTGTDRAEAAVWVGDEHAIVYVANLTNKPAAGAAKVAKEKIAGVLGGKKVSVIARSSLGSDRIAMVSPREVLRGIPFKLQPNQSVVFHVKPAAVPQQAPRGKVKASKR